jgi:ABC-type amino acid transport substrate-binding protein
MKKIKWFLALFCLNISLLHAQAVPLRIAVVQYLPPFVMEGAHQLLYGFDIAMMQSICKLMQRPCQFIKMDFQYLFNTLESDQVDIGLGSIIITPERAQRISFSKPYLMSQSHFVTTPSSTARTFGPAALKGKKIGVIKGSVFASQIETMGIKDVEIYPYDNDSDLIDALVSEDVDFLLMDAPSAHYYAAVYTNTLRLFGPPLTYGLGLGIAVNTSNPILLQSINAALATYQKSDDYKKNYRMYLESF